MILSDDWLKIMFFLSACIEPYIHQLHMVYIKVKNLKYVVELSP